MANDKLIAAALWFENRAKNTPMSATRSMFEMAAVALREKVAGVPEQKWIPVEEKLPEKHGGVYLCLIKFPEANMAFPHCLTWYAYGDNGYVNGPHFSDEGLDGMKVTHWMPLPEPPKEGVYGNT